MVHALIDSSYELSFADPDRAIRFAEQALEIAKKIDYPKGIAKAHRELGYSNGVKGNFETALNHHEKGISYNQKSGDTLGIISQLNDIGNLYKTQTQYDTALEYFFQAIELSEANELDRATASISGNIGLVYFELDNEERAQKFYERALEINRRLDNRHGMSINYNNLGLLYGDQGKYEQALEYHFQALKMRRDLEYIIRIANSLNNIGRIYMQQNNYSEAINYLNRALKRNDDRDPDLTSIIHENLAKVYYFSERNDSALIHAKKTLMLSQDFGSLLGEKVGHKLLSDIYSTLGDYKKAFLHQKKLRMVEDSILNKEKSQQINELQTKYEAAQKEKEIALLEKENQRKTFMRNAVMAGLVMVGIIGFLIYNRQRLKINKNRTELENIRLKEKQLENDLEFKNKQLTTHSLHLVQKNETMKELKHKINSICQQDNGDINRALQKLRNMVDYSFSLDDDWKQFRLYFEEVHTVFFKALNEHYPDLTPNELRLSALAKLNLSIKETATILGITPESVKTARYRLRKKLDIETEENLTEFMMEIEKREIEKSS
ncbi:tetratricopeptide repeat protein [Fodinibius halophilus]|uniref:tetratricopeptide repeat protein n=1 Tax=Fodinibius halophilus TaxID=1736908 RepID=UPI00197AEDA0|nr:tetratricopeptide repeat protein [Fodinibius halophilus]